MTPSLLSDVDTTTVPLSVQLARAASQVAALHISGAAPPYLSHELSGLALFLLGAADRARDLEHAAALRRVRRLRRPRSVWAMVRRMAGSREP
jgi:hypothetical protein